MLFSPTIRDVDSYDYYEVQKPGCSIPSRSNGVDHVFVPFSQLHSRNINRRPPRSENKYMVEKEEMSKIINNHGYIFS